MRFVLTRTYFAFVNHTSENAFLYMQENLENIKKKIGDERELLLIFFGGDKGLNPAYIMHCPYHVS